MPTTLDPTLALAIRLFLALLFGFAAWSKLRNLSVFAEDLRGYRILSDGMVRMAAPGIALSEGALLLGLLLMPASPLPALGAVLLLLGYGGAIAINLLRGRRDLSCGCGGLSADQPIGWPLVWRNLVVAAAGSVLLLETAPRALIWVDFVSAVLASLFLAALYAAADLLIRVQARLMRGVAHD